MLTATLLLCSTLCMAAVNLEFNTARTRFPTYQPHPLTKAEAVLQGYKMLSSCEMNPEFGYVYQSDSTDMIGVIYNADGLFSGLMGMAPISIFPVGTNPTFKTDYLHGMAAVTRDPKTICQKSPKKTVKTTAAPTTKPTEPAVACAGDFGQKPGDQVCCGQTGTIAWASQICPQSHPICRGFVQGGSMGTCGAISWEPTPNRCYGLNSNPATTAEACQSACAADTDCEVYQFFEYWGQPCWMGKSTGGCRGSAPTQGGRKQSSEPPAVTVKVCYKDNCSGTSTNPIPQGEQWINQGQASASGCCAWGSGACNLCAQPTGTESGVGWFMDSSVEEALGQAGDGDAEDAVVDSDSYSDAPSDSPIGNELWFMHATDDGKRTWIQVPGLESDINKCAITYYRGMCFHKMGMHYYPDYPPTTPDNHEVPPQLLYIDGMTVGLIHQAVPSIPNMKLGADVSFAPHWEGIGNYYGAEGLFSSPIFIPPHLGLKIPTATQHNIFSTKVLDYFCPGMPCNDKHILLKHNADGSFSTFETDLRQALEANGIQLGSGAVTCETAKAFCYINVVTSVCCDTCLFQNGADVPSGLDSSDAGIGHLGTASSMLADVSAVDVSEASQFELGTIYGLALIGVAAALVGAYKKLAKSEFTEINEVDLDEL